MALNNSTPTIIPAGGSFSIRGNGEISNIVATGSATTTFDGDTTSLLTIKDCTFTTTGPIVNPVVITRLQDAKFDLANKAGCLIGTGINNTIRNTQITNCILVANSGGLSADAIIGTVSGVPGDGLNVNGLW